MNAWHQAGPAELTTMGMFAKPSIPDKIWNVKNAIVQKRLESWPRYAAPLRSTSPKMERATPGCPSEINHPTVVMAVERQAL
jgi:hypothetical protein